MTDQSIPGYNMSYQPIPCYSLSDQSIPGYDMSEQSIPGHNMSKQAIPGYTLSLTSQYQVIIIKCQSTVCVGGFFVLVVGCFDIKHLYRQSNI